MYPAKIQRIILGGFLFRGIYNSGVEWGGGKLWCLTFNLGNGMFFLQCLTGSLLYFYEDIQYCYYYLLPNPNNTRV